MSETITLPLAFVAGLLSFVSPCVLPLLPSYLGFLGAAASSGPVAAGEAAAGKTGRFRLFTMTLIFALGFSTVFIVLSVVSSTMFMVMSGIAEYLNIIAGIIVIVLGLNVLFDFLKILNYEKRFHINPDKRPRGCVGAFLMGLAFGSGWTPCIGPALAAILLMAGQTGKTGAAVLYLALYSAGLALPFCAADLCFDTISTRTKGLRKHLGLIRNISGVLLILIGVLMLTGRMTAINAFFARFQGGI
jgi:cytochrome c-type biogenesis protein